MVLYDHICGVLSSIPSSIMVLIMIIPIMSRIDFTAIARCGFDIARYFSAKAILVVLFPLNCPRPTVSTRIPHLTSLRPEKQSNMGTALSRPIALAISLPIPPRRSIDQIQVDTRTKLTTLVQQHYILHMHPRIPLLSEIYDVFSPKVWSKATCYIDALYATALLS